MNTNEVKKHLREYVETITERSPRGGKNAYICPLCHSGTGTKQTGAFFIYEDIKWKCHSCGESGDIFDLVGKIEGIQDIKSRFQRVEKLFSTQDNYIHNNIYIDTQYKTEPIKEETDYTEFFKEAHSHLSETDYYRGISRKTLDRFNVGFVKEWEHPKAKGYKSSRLIIPTSSTSYVARATDANNTEKVKKVGNSNIFNIEALKDKERPVFVVEGEIDALSIIDLGFNAVGLGGVGNYRKFLDYIKDQRAETLPPLIISLDNDEAGKKCSKALQNSLKSLKIEFYEFDAYKECKDANEALNKNREQFLGVLQVYMNEIIGYNREQYRSEIEEYKAEIERESVSYSLDNFVKEIKEKQDYNAISTGFNTLDNILDGGLYAGLYIVGAISSLGKTTFCLQIADQIATSGKDVLIFSLEMAKNELIAKSVSRFTYIETLLFDKDSSIAKTTRGILTGSRYKNYNEEEKSLIWKAISEYDKKSAKHIFITEGTGNVGTKEIRERVERHIRITGNTPVVLIDYLQILKPFDSRSTDKQNTDKAITDLKRLSRDLAIPIVGISSFNRDNYTSPVNLSSFKESGAIEYSSDVLIGLQYKGMDYNDKQDNGNRGEGEASYGKRVREIINKAIEADKKGEPREIQLKILKNRNGQRGSVFFNYYSLFNYFEEDKTTEDNYRTAAIDEEEGFTEI